jgi:hypothetical protein
MKKLIGQQGEVRIIKVDAIPEGIETKPVDRVTAGWVISHSESGNHHVLEEGDVMERVNDVPEGMKMLYAVVEQVTSLKQDTGGNPHEKFDLPPGIYEFRISREFDPFAEQARQVAD